jgi:hypothetical protein
MDTKMETCCDSCDCPINNERDAYEYEPLGILVCEDCHELLLGIPIETEDPDVEMEDMMANMSISAGK